MTTSLATGSPITSQQVYPVLAPRPADGHKGTFGSVAILGGAAGMTGAAMLAARAALKAGAGKVFVALVQTPIPVAYDTVHPELMLNDAESLLEDAANMSAWAAGCGLGQASHALAMLRQLFLRRQERPLVLDADGLNALACGSIAPTWGRGEVVLTPHPTEAARLLATDTTSIQEDRPGAAKAISQRYDAWVVLKGANTIVCAPDQSWQTNPTGNVGLATGGTGDVLGGIIVSLLAQGFEAAIAVPAAVWLHGAAADLLVERGIGPIGMVATDLTDAVRDLRNHTTTLARIGFH